MREERERSEGQGGKEGEKSGVNRRTVRACPPVATLGMTSGGASWRRC